MGSVGDGAWRCGSIVGLGNEESKWVRLSQEGKTVTREIESPIGVFIVCVDPEVAGRIEVGDVRGNVLGMRDFSPN
jgi:hypothetical protein